MNIPRILTVVDLAAIFGMDPGELLILTLNRPELLPARLSTHGVALLRWRREDVQSWIVANRLDAEK